MTTHNFNFFSYCPPIKLYTEPHKDGEDYRHFHVFVYGDTADDAIQYAAKCFLELIGDRRNVWLRAGPNLDHDHDFVSDQEKWRVRIRGCAWHDPEQS